MCTDFTRKLQLLGEALGVDVSDRVRRLVLDGGGSVKLVVSGVTETDTVALGEIEIPCRDATARFSPAAIGADSEIPAARVKSRQKEFAAIPDVRERKEQDENAFSHPVGENMEVEVEVPAMTSAKRKASTTAEKAATKSRTKKKVGSNTPLQRINTTKEVTNSSSGGGGIFPENKVGLGLLERIWYGIYEGPMMANFFNSSKDEGFLDNPSIGLNLSSPVGVMSHENFRELNGKCSAIFQSTRGIRILEIIMQASWVDFFNARIESISLENPSNTPTENKMAALHEARLAFSCSEKAMRNKLAIWQGYKRIKDAGGWPALIFAEDGVYTICKYRLGFKDGSLFLQLRELRSAIELAADTVQPDWRRFLKIVQIVTAPVYTGHPHQWTIGKNGVPVPLKESYPWTRDYVLIEESVVDTTQWSRDPRRIADGPTFVCPECEQVQDDDPQVNRCRCFLELYGGVKMPAPVQIFDTASGKGNGVITRFELPKGTAIGEFVGLITRGKVGVDVMEGGGESGKYHQISQGKIGNFTRFINHSCNPNCQFERFVWMGIERIVAVALRMIEAGAEVTVDYSRVYWEGLDKICRCGEPCCRYSGPRELRSDGQ